MLKIAYNPKAYLAQKRNVRLGLVARSKILQVVEKQALPIAIIRDATGLKYAVILHHLRLLEEEKVVQREGKKGPYAWALTGAGQRRLVES
jgi:predicted transcriptional regulator